MISRRIVARFLSPNLAFKYAPKESKKSKVERLRKHIVNMTGIGRAVAEDIADAFLRNRDLRSLRIQKSWPMDEDGCISGPLGKLHLSEKKHSSCTTDAES